MALFMDKRIYLVRHGKIDSGDEKRYIGITDLPLSKEGMDQARRLKAYFSGINIEKAYISPLIRCVQTAEIVLEGKNIERIQVKALKEINMGEWEGKSFAYIKSRFPDQYENRGIHIDRFMPPGGESFEQLQKRVMLAIKSIIGNVDGNTLIIAHAGVNRVILSGLLAFPLNMIMYLPQPYGCVDVLSRDKTYQNWNCETVL